MIDGGLEYEFASTQFRWCSDRIGNVFYVFVQTFSAIVAGSIYLSVQPGVRQHVLSYAVLSDTAVSLSALVTLVLIWETHASRRGYRERISHLGGKDTEGKFHVPLPKSPRVLVEQVMTFAILAASLAFGVFNPFMWPYLAN